MDLIALRLVLAQACKHSIAAQADDREKAGGERDGARPQTTQRAVVEELELCADNDGQGEQAPVDDGVSVQLPSKDVESMSSCLIKIGRIYHDIVVSIAMFMLNCNTEFSRLKYKESKG